MPDPCVPNGDGIVIAGGCPRSGLTVLRKILATHPRFRTGPDTGAAPAVAFQWREFATNLGNLHRDYFDLDDDAVAAIMGRFLAAILRQDGEPRIVFEKTSLNAVAFEPLARILPAARFIHVVRDGRDVAASLLDRDWTDPRTGAPFAHVADPLAAMTYWTRLAGIGLAGEDALGRDGRILRVRYEDLAADPDAEAARICGFLGVEWPPPELAPAPGAADYFGLERESLPALLGPVTTSRIGRWRERFTGEERRALEEIGRGALRALGYM